MRFGMTRVKIVGTGGTIANTVQGRISLDQLLDEVPQAREITEIETEEVVRVGSGALNTGHWLDTARAVDAAARDDRFDAVLVTHGTFTVEETAFFLHLVVRTEKPVVVVASQRRHGEPGNDGDQNLLDALRVALQPEARGKGVLFVLNEEIHSAREVVKGNQRPGGFVSRGVGLLGSVEADQVSFYRAPLRRHTFRSEFDIRELGSLPRVDIVASYPDADGVAIRAFVAAGARGIVVHGYAYSGTPTDAQKEALVEAQAAGVAVVQASRGGAGRVPLISVGYPPSPFLKGDNLPAQKARILLMLALTRTSAAPELQRIFHDY
jgi:L-asparaginase